MASADNAALLRLRYLPADGRPDPSEFPEQDLDWQAEVQMFAKTALLEDESLDATLDHVREDPFALDSIDVGQILPRPRRILTVEPFETGFDGINVENVLAAPEFQSARSHPARLLRDLRAAFRLLMAMRDPETAAVISLGHKPGLLFCLLLPLLGKKRGPVVVYRTLWPANPGQVRRIIYSRALSQAAVSILSARSPAEGFSRIYDTPREKFIFIPYKSNHSQTGAARSRPMPVGDYIFSGGDSERDYATLFKAVDGLPIPVIVSRRKDAVTKGLAIPQNVILLKAMEPAFERLMAGSRIVVVPINKTIVRGAGEGTFVNAMWHGRPLIAADNVAAADYIDDGTDGFVVPAGDAEALRHRILQLWNDRDFAERMAEAGRQKVTRLYTHKQYKQRLVTLALLLYKERRGAPLS
jgi:glycosyltransferase involved in cell wall biosynthesis